MNLSSPLLTLVVLTAGVLQSPATLAVEGSNAIGYCQGALPSFDTEIRKRPLAVRNEASPTRSSVALSLTTPRAATPRSVSSWSTVMPS